ncbi:M48 family metalloprotease [Candidatus Poribacteria bacterium]|nr:M48 family metalloprotease [Candidatus Poribacteria bacterium]
MSWLTLTGCAAFRNAERGLTRMTFTTDQEMALGLEYSKQISQEVVLIEDPDAQAWVDRVGEALVANSPKSGVPFQFRVTASPEVNAFAIPGGFCYVNVGLILYADNEAQVVAVVGHEINHVTGRHGLMSLNRAVGVETVATLASSQIEDERQRAAAVLAAQGGGFLATRRFGRDDEREADHWGIEAMYKAGWDPRQGVEFFRKLHALHGGATPGLLQQMVSTHPATPERIAYLEKQVAGYDLLSVPLTVDSPEFESLKTKLKAQYGGTGGPS